MIENATALQNGAVVEGDLCIIGSGAAGIALALELVDSGLNIIMLTGGAEKESADDRDLYRGYASPAGSHEPLEENRRRVYGGTTTAWGGRCIPYDRIDFADRKWLKESGWPISFDDVAPYFARASALCEAGKGPYDAAEMGLSRPEMIKGFDCESISTTRLERWSPPTNFAAKYGDQLTSAANITVLLNAHALELLPDASGTSIDALRAASSPGREFRVRCRRYVLACGGLENTRLLLASDSMNPAGIGNEFDNVGRYYMSHLLGTAAYAELTVADDDFQYDFERDVDGGVYFRRRFWLTESAQIDHQVGNAIAYFFRPPAEGDHAIHRDPLFSATYLARYYLRVFKRYGLRGARRQMRADKPSLRSHWRAFLRGAPRFAPTAVKLIRARFFDDRRLPMVLAPKSSERHYLFFQTEHVPNRDSRVVLHPERDAFGVPRLAVEARFCDQDFDTVLAFHRVLAQRFAETGAGRLVYDEAELDAQLHATARSFNSNAHHIGTTRMSSDPRDGVVDADCRVHSVDNLFVAGSSIFSTSGHANPTLLIVALAARLANHLRSDQPSSASSSDTSMRQPTVRRDPLTAR